MARVSRRLLVHVIDGTSRDPIGDYQAIQQELELFSSDLAAKPQLVAYNKMDVPDSSDYWDSVQEFLLSQVCHGVLEGADQGVHGLRLAHMPQCRDLRRADCAENGLP